MQGRAGDRVDRGVETDCPVTFIHPIGRYAYGADAAEFLVENVDSGGKVLALRILPGVDVPPITGEDQQDFLIKWQEEGWTALAPTYPTYQWRTSIIAALKVVKGEEVPKEWVLPQPKISQDNLDQYVQPDMPPLHYALCGCEDMPGFPGPWQ